MHTTASIPAARRPDGVTAITATATVTRADLADLADPACASATDSGTERASTDPAAASAAAGRRDPAIDLVRALCVLAVVVLHGIQVGVTVTGPAPVLEYTTVNAPWYPPLTWILQVMPIFFVIGGFAGALALRRLLARGGTSTDFVVGRVHRLLLPAIVTVLAVGMVLAWLGILGVPAELLGLAGVRYGQPLWFLGVFLACQALLPALLRAHDRAAVRTLVMLVIAAVTVDALRGLTSIDALGYTNIAFVWLALQQLGFFLVDGPLDALSPAVRRSAGAAAVAVLIGGVVAGIWTPDLIAHLNPPTIALLLVGAAQTAALSLLRPALAELSAHPWIEACTRFVTARTMTIYLWNLPVLLAMAGVSAVLALRDGMPLPEPSGLMWWTTRPWWLVLSIVLTFALAAVLGSIERRRPARPTRLSRRALQDVLLGLIGVLILLLAGTTVLTAGAAVGLFLAALSRIRARVPREDSASPPRVRTVGR
ncbi:acyltransferase family protein [Brachybacterium alimentarium]|uniref:acyltransferase family protein n=1 Tax=Brachybacterium alimentarium TaxID=47845 RepID=UPI003FCF6718